tara:strand:+ start:330 stop:581 length:252 start_codon:yes stop_codon:yes gene_type:complete
VIVEFTKSLKQLESAFKADPKSVIFSSNELEKNLNNLKELSLTDSSNKSHLKSTTKLIEKLSILNEYKLNLIKEFSLYNNRKK